MIHDDRADGQWEKSVTDCGILRRQRTARPRTFRRTERIGTDLIDEVVLFSPLTPAEARSIAAQYLSTINTTVARAGKTLSIDDDVLDAIVAKGHSPVYGARFLKRVIDERIKLPISSQWHDTVDFHVGVEDGDVVVGAQRFVSV